MPPTPPGGGGRHIDRYGYIMLLAPENGRSNKYVPEHILVAEARLGRRLAKAEVVHHINGIKDDNRPVNLAVMDRAAHRRLHAELERICWALYAEGAIEWDGNTYQRVA